MNYDDIQLNEEVYSVSMGKGRVIGKDIHSVTIQHGAVPWRYNLKLVRTGCKHSDLVRSPEQIYLSQTDMTTRQRKLFETFIESVLKP